MANIDPEVLKTCKENISELIEDAEKNITLPLLSNNFGLEFNTCCEVIEMWLKENSDKSKKLNKTFFVQYRDQNGNIHVSIVNEEKLQSLKKKHKELTEMLYGISITTSNRSIGLVERYENVDIPIRIESTERKFHYQPKLNPVAEAKPKEKPTAAGTKSINNMFAQASSSSSNKVLNKPEPEANKEQDSVKVKKPTPKKKESPVKKNTAKPTAPKGNIASFFSKGAAKLPIPKTSTSTTVEVKKEVKLESKDAPHVTPPTNVTNKKKRSANERESEDDEVIPGTPVEVVKKVTRVSKKFKPAKKVAEPEQKHSRIMQIDDSSDDNDEEEKAEFDPEERQIQYKFEEDVVEIVEEPKSSKLPSTSVSSVTVPSKETGIGKKRKGKKFVDRTYIDDEGYVVTKKEYEEYSLSEEEVIEKPKKIKAMEKEKPKDKPKSAATGNTKTKQGSLLNFFTKK